MSDDLIREQSEKNLRGLGERLRQKREDLGLSLKEIYLRTRIRPQFLEGIEKGEYSAFPSPVYTRGFIRTYLKQLGEEELWEEFLPLLRDQEELLCPGGMTMGTCSPPAKGFRPASKFWIFAVLLMAVVGTSWYVWFTWSRDEIPSFTVRESPIAQESGEEDAVGDKLPASADIVSPDLPVVVPPPHEVVKPAAPEVVKDKNLTITADGDCWVHIRRGGETLLSRTLRAGESVTHSAADVRLYVTYGRSGSVRVRWNGEDMGRPGQNRGVERVYYDPDGTTGGFAK